MDLGHGTVFFWQISTYVLWDLVGSQETHESHRTRCVPLDSLSGVGGNCLECVRLFVGGTYGGGVIVPRHMFALLCL